jgi:hypothetical protein
LTPAPGQLQDEFADVTGYPLLALVLRQTNTRVCQ